MVQEENKLDFLHFSFWLLKDICWLLKWKLLATIMVIPTFLLTVYILFKTKKFISSTGIFSSWVMMNIFWMLHELYDIPLFFAKSFIVIGLITLVSYIFLNRKK